MNKSKSSEKRIRFKTIGMRPEIYERLNDFLYEYRFNSFGDVLNYLLDNVKLPKKVIKNEN